MTDAPTLQKILYVDDDEILRTITRMGLERLGDYTVEVCDDGRSAVAKALAFAPDLILLDVMMPGMDGPATLSALRREPALQSTAVIFITAKIQPQEVQRYMELGIAGVIAKPFEPLRLSGQIRTIWELWRDRAISGPVDAGV